MAESAEDALFGFVGGSKVGGIFETLNFSFLIGSEVFGNVNHDVDELVANAVAIGRGEAFATKSKHFARLGSGSDFDTSAACDGWHFSRATECCSGNIKHKVVDNIVAVASEFGMFDFFNDNKQISIYATSTRSVAFAFDG